MLPSQVVTNKKKWKREKDPPPVPGVRKSPQIRGDVKMLMSDKKLNFLTFLFDPPPPPKTKVTKS